MYSVKTNVFSITLKINTFQKLLCSMYNVYWMSMQFKIFNFVYKNWSTCVFCYRVIEKLKYVVNLNMNYTLYSLFLRRNSFWKDISWLKFSVYLSFVVHNSRVHFKYYYYSFRCKTFADTKKKQLISERKNMTF